MPMLVCCSAALDGGAFRIAEGRGFHVESSPNGIGVGYHDLLLGGGFTIGRHGSVSLGVAGGFWGGPAQGQHVAACLSAWPDRKCSAA